MNGTSTDQLIESGKKLLEGVDTNAIAKFLLSIDSFFTNTLGVDLREGARLVGKFFIWFFELFIKFITWILSLL